MFNEELDKNGKKKKKRDEGDEKKALQPLVNML